MAKQKRIVSFFTLFTLIVGLIIAFGIFKSDGTDMHSEETLSVGLMSSETVDIVVDKDSVYGLIYSSDAFQGDQAIANEFKKLITVSSNKFRPYPDTRAETEFEILIGNTNRAYSKELLGIINSTGSAEELYIWGFGYKDGKLAFAANSNIGYELGKKDFLALVSESGTLSVSSDLLVINYMTHEEYEEILRLEKEKERQEKIDALIEKNNAFADEPRLNEGYMSMIGDENAYYQVSPYGKPWVYPAADQHPRYLITEDNVERIKEMMNDPEYTIIFSNLKKLAAQDIKDGIFPERTGGSGETYRYDTGILSGISARAMMYLLTGDELYAREAIVAIKNAILTLKYTTDIHMDVYHGASHVMAVLASVYDWCYDMLTEEDKWQMITGAVTCLWPTMEFDYPPANYNAVSGHGTGPQFLRDYMSLAVAFYDEAPDWWEFVVGRYFNEYLPVANEQYAKGWVSQGTATYAPIKVMVIEWAAYVVKVCTGENFFTEEASLSMQFLQSHIMPNGNYFQTGDGGRNPNGSALGYAEYFVNAALFNDPFSLAWAKYTTNDYKKYDTGSIFTMTPDLQLCFISMVTAPKVEKTETIELVQYFFDPVGQMTARDSWEADAAAAFMRVGNLTNANHDIYDHGTFQIYYKGLLAATSGSYKHYGGDSHYYYLQCTVAHNGLLIFNPNFASDANMNGDDVLNPSSYYYSGSQHRLPGASTLDQWHDESYRMAETTGVSWGYDRDGSTKYAYLAGDITQAYDDVTVDYVGRRMFTVYTGDPDIPMVFLTFDEITSKKESYEKTFLLHTVKEPEIDAENLSATIVNGDGKLVMQSLFGADRIEKIGGEGKAYWINDYYKEDGTYVPGKNCLDEYTPDDNYMNIWGRVQLRTVGEKTSNLLTAMYVTDASSTATLEISKYQNDSVYGASFDREIVMFYAGTDKAYKPFTFDTEGIGLYNYYISGISDGTWNVKVDGVSVAYTLSSDESGMITFVAPAGTVELTPGKDVMGANGGKIQYITGGAMLPDDTYYAYNRETATPLPVTAVRGKDTFLGWYTSPTFEPETKVYEVPVGTEGTFKVYAKWLATFAHEDYTEAIINHKENNQSINGITYAGYTKPGSSFMTLAGEDGRRYLEWLEGSSDSFVYSVNNSNNMTHAVSEDKSISYTVEFSGNPGSTLMASSFQIIAKVDVNGAAWGGSASTYLFTTDTAGNILLGGSKVIGQYTTDRITTLRIVVDFKYGQINAYDETGYVIASVPYTVPAQLGTTSTEESMKCYTQYLFYWHGDTSKTIADAGMRIYGIKMQDSNIFEGGGSLGNNAIDYKKNGGMLPSDAPLQYSNEENTALPANVTRAGYTFTGWYTTPTFDEGTRTYYVPADTSGIYTVYAKWNYVAVDTDFTDSNINITESTSGSGAGLSFNAGSSGELKPGSGFVTETDPDGNAYLKASVGTKNAIIYKADNSYNLTSFTETSISYSMRLKKLAGVDLPQATLRIATSGGAYGELLIMSIDEAGNAKLQGSANTFATIGEGVYTDINITVDFAASTITAYAADGTVLDSVSVTKVPSGGSGAPATLLDWQKVAKSYLFYFMISRSNKIEGAVSSLAIDDLMIAEGSIFEGAEVVIPSISGIVYETDGGRLPADAPKEYDTVLGTLLPADITRAGYIFAGWYTDAELTQRTYYVPSGTEGVYKVYAKWYKVITDEDYTGKDFLKDSGQDEVGGIVYNALNNGVSIGTESDESGNTYLRVNNEIGKQNAVIRVTDSATKLGIAGFNENAISFEMSFSKIKDIDLSTLYWLLQSSGGAGGKGEIAIVVSDENGNIKLNGGTVSLGTITEGSFTKVRIGVDFEAGTVSAFDEDGNVIDLVRPSAPSGFTSLAQWQREGLKHHILFANFNNVNAADSGIKTGILVDDIKIVDGYIFGKKETIELPSITGIEYVTGGGTLPEDAPKEYDPILGTLLPTLADGANGIFAGWYKDEGLTEPIYYIPAGTEGRVKVYAKWYTVLTDESYTDIEINKDSGQDQIRGIWYNALNDGVSFKTETDESGNTYLRVNNEVGRKNAVVRTTDSAYNLTSFNEDAISFEMSLSKIPGVELSTLSWSFESSSGVGGVGRLNLLFTDAAGDIMLAGGKVSLGTITEGTFTTIRLGIDFAAGTVSAFDIDGKIIDTVTPAAPSGFASLAQWQKEGLKHHILFASFTNSNDADSGIKTGMLVDGIKVVDGMIFGEKTAVELPSIKGIEYVLNGGTLSESAPEEYDPEAGTTLPTPTRSDAIFAGWYTTSAFDEQTRVTKIEAGTVGTVKVYAKWTVAIASDNFDGAEIVAEGTNSSHGRTFGLGTPNAGTKMETVKDDGGNTYLKVSVNENRNAFIYHYSASYNLTAFKETAVSWELDMAKLADTPFTTVYGNIPTSGGKQGDLSVFRVDGVTGDVSFVGSEVVIATIGEDFSTIRITVDFEAGTALAYDAEYNVIDTVTLTVPTAAEGTQPETMAEWQKIAVNYTFYLSIVKGSAEDATSALLLDNIKIFDGRVFEK